MSNVSCGIILETKAVASSKKEAKKRSAYCMIYRLTYQDSSISEIHLSSTVPKGSFYSHSVGNDRRNEGSTTSSFTTHVQGRGRARQYFVASGFHRRGAQPFRQTDYRSNQLNGASNQSNSNSYNSNLKNKGTQDTEYSWY